jgi:hypothetical protein
VSFIIVTIVDYASFIFVYYSKHSFTIFSGRDDDENDKGMVLWSGWRDVAPRANFK